MAAYVKKPVEVQAERWDGPQAPEGVCQPCGAYQNGPHIHTNEGFMSIAPGYWVVTAADGRKWAVDNDYFQANYEAVEQKPAKESKETTVKKKKSKKGGKC